LGGPRREGRGGGGRAAEEGRGEGAVAAHPESTGNPPEMEWARQALIISVSSSSKIDAWRVCRDSALTQARRPAMSGAALHILAALRRSCSARSGKLGG